VHITPSLLLFFIFLLLLTSWMTSIMIMIHSYVVLTLLSSPTPTSLCFQLHLPSDSAFPTLLYLYIRLRPMYRFPWNDYGLSLPRARVRSFPELYSTSSTLPVPSDLLTFQPSNLPTFSLNHPHSLFVTSGSSASLLVSSGRGLDRMLDWQVCRSKVHEHYYIY